MREKYLVDEGVVEGLDVDVCHGVEVGEGAGGELELDDHFEFFLPSQVLITELEMVLHMTHISFKSWPIDTDTSACCRVSHCL